MLLVLLAFVVLVAAQAKSCVNGDACGCAPSGTATCHGSELALVTSTSQLFVGTFSPGTDGVDDFSCTTNGGSVGCFAHSSSGITPGPTSGGGALPCCTINGVISNSCTPVPCSTSGSFCVDANLEGGTCSATNECVSVCGSTPGKQFDTGANCTDQSQTVGRCFRGVCTRACKNNAQVSTAASVCGPKTFAFATDQDAGGVVCANMTFTPATSRIAITSWQVGGKPGCVVDQGFVDNFVGVYTLTFSVNPNTGHQERVLQCLTGHCTDQGNEIILSTSNYAAPCFVEFSNVERKRDPASIRAVLSGGSCGFPGFDAQHPADNACY